MLRRAFSLLWPWRRRRADLVTRITAQLDADLAAAERASEHRHDGPVPLPGPGMGVSVVGAPMGDASPPSPGIAARAMGWVFDAFTNTMSGIGTAGDRATQSAVALTRTPLSQPEIDALYRYDGYARRLVDLVPDIATRNAGKITAEGVEGDPLEQSFSDLGAWNAIAEGWRLARKDGSALTLMVLDEDIPPEYRDQPGRWLAQPLDLSRVRRVVALVTFERAEFDAASWETAMRSGRYRQVRTWRISPNLPMGDLRGDGEIHASRCLYWDGAYVNPIQRYGQNGHGDSILEAVYEQVRSKSTADQVFSSLLHELKINVLKLRGLAGRQVSDQAAAFEARMRTLAKSRSMLNMVLLDEGEDFTTQAQALGGYSDLDERLSASLAAVAGVPQTVLFGDSPGGLNADGESARGNLAVMIGAAQEWIAAPNLRRLAEVLFASREGPTGGRVPERWSLEWAPLDSPTQKAVAELRKLHAERDAVYLQWGVLSAEQVARSRFGPQGYADEIAPMDLDEPIAADVIAEAVAEQARTQGPAGRADAESFKVPESARNNARRVLRWREEHPGEIRGMTAVGWRRARQLATQAEVGIETVAKMAQFARHRKNAAVAPEFEGEPWRDPGHVAWLGWGGTSGIEWAREIMAARRNDAGPTPHATRADAEEGGGLWLGLDLAGDAIAKWAGARDEAAAILGESFEPYTGTPHVTLAWFGEVDRATAEALTGIVVDELRRGWSTGSPIAGAPEDFERGPDGHPIVVTVIGCDALRELRGRIVGRVVDLLGEDHPVVETLHRWWWRPHATIGYAVEVTEDARAAMWHATAVGWPLAFGPLRMMHGGVVVGEWDAR